METTIVPGTIFKAEFTWLDTMHNPKALWICGEIVDWHFKVHHFTGIDSYWEILKKPHLSYSYRLIEAKGEEGYEEGAIYVVQGRNLFLNATQLIDVPRDADDQIDSLKFDFYRAYVLEEAAAKVIRFMKDGFDKRTAYERVHYIYDFCDK